MESARTLNYQVHVSPALLADDLTTLRLHKSVLLQSTLRFHDFTRENRAQSTGLGLVSLSRFFHSFAAHSHRLFLRHGPGKRKMIKTLFSKRVALIQSIRRTASVTNN